MNKIYLFAVLMLLIAGCNSEGSLDKYYAKESSEIHKSPIIDLNDPDIYCDSTDTDCVCMVCKNDNFDIVNPFNKFYSIDLQGGNCRFQKDCSKDVFLSYSDSPDYLGLFGSEQVRFFMLGQGSNFAEFADATRYCNNSLRMAVRWLSSTEGYEYPLPAQSRAECLMEKDVLPVYLLYSQGKAIDSIRAGEIAATFVDSGPVILSTEFDSNPYNYSELDLVIDQAITMKDSCPNCLIAISPKLEYNYSLDENGKPFGYNATYSALDYIFENSPQSEIAKDKIDLVGVGINSHHARNCMASSLIWDGVSYSKYALRKYQKPSVWAYFLIDSAQQDSGGIERNDCVWSESESVKAYSDLYKYIPSLVDSGVIGAAPYSLYGLGSGPIPCTNCSMMDVDGNQYPQHVQWFSLCQVYYTGDGIIPIVFSSSSCADCSFATNYNMFQLNEFRSGVTLSKAELELRYIEPFETFFRCNGQLMTEVPEEINLGAYSYHTGDRQCGWYPELDIFSDLRDSDPVLSRAITWMETGFNSDLEGPGGDMCEASIVSESQCSSSSHPRKCLTTLTDPSGVCIGGARSAPPSKVFHSMGIMQVHTYPQELWGKLDKVDYEDEARTCGGEDGFNPFDKADNACLGSAIILDKLRLGKQFVSSHETQLGLTALKSEFGEYNSKYLNMKNAYTIFISSYYYSGFTTMHSGAGGGKKLDKWLIDFSAQRRLTDADCFEGPGETEGADTGTSQMSSELEDKCCKDGKVKEGPCCNQGNFINYLQSCKFPSLSSSSRPKAKYGLKILGFYKALLTCEKYDEAQHTENLIDYLTEANDWDKEEASSD